MTDGEENSSKEYTQEQMRTLIKEREDKGNWTFVYLGANQDSYKMAQKYGISQMNTTNFSATNKGITRAMHTMATNTSNFAMNANASTSTFFSQTDQSNIAGSDPQDDKIKAHFSSLGKKSWEARKRDILGE